MMLRWHRTPLTAENHVRSLNLREWGGRGLDVAKNILIFSDGTGMAGGITFDEDRTNIVQALPRHTLRPR